jgi:nucleotide-binding universal stress UspA family protein
MHIQRILCAVDFSDASREAVHFSTELARQFGSTVVLFHVYQLPGYSLPEGVVLPGPETLAKLFDRINSVLDEWKGDVSKREVPVETATAQGSPWAEIVERAKQDIQLIVVGSHGHTGLRHVLLGSTAERVVRHAPCPVLTVRTTDHAIAD